MPSEPRHSGARPLFAPSDLLGILGLAVAYAAAARFGLSLTVERYATLIWPPTGIAVAVLCRAGLRYWPGVFLGALLALVDRSPFWHYAGIAVGNTLGPVVAAAALRRLRLDRALARPSDVWLLVVVGAALAMLVPPTCGVLTLRAGGAIEPDHVPWVWLTWYLGDVLGVVLVAPIVLTFDRDAVRRARAREVAVAAVWLVVAAGVSALAFSNSLEPPLRMMAIFPPFLLVLVIGLTQGLRLGMLHVLVFATAAAAGTAAGLGPLGRYADPQARVLMVWATGATAAAVVLILTTLTAQRDRAMREVAAVAGDYEALVEDNPALICRFGPDGVIRYLNDTLERFLGLAREQWRGRNLFEFIRPEDRPEVQLRLTRTDEAGPLELLHNTPQGDRIVRWLGRKVRLGDGTLVEVHAVGLDVTAERRAEDERRAIEGKLVETQRLEALGVLSGGLAHDFNNILTGVIGHTELAAGTLPPDHPAQSHLGTIKTGAARAAALVRQLLAYSGKGRFLSRPVSLNTLIRQTADLMAVTIPKKVELVLALAPDLPTVTADESQLQQLVMNLLINAGEAIGEATGTVTVATAAREVRADETPFRESAPPHAGRYVELTVTDTGCGMDDATRGRLFDPFFTTKFTGRGLGLSAVLGIVRAHHGTIRVESRPGVGTRFTVRLPADPAPAAPAATAAQLEESPMPPDRHPREPNRGVALVVDDEPSVRAVAAEMLRQLGYDVIQAADGLEAVGSFTAHADAVRLIVLDLMMPVMGGAEALAEIRRTHPHVPVVLCSGYTADSLSPTVLGSPTTTFLRKPFQRRDLRRAIAAVLGADEGPPSPNPPAAAPAAG